MAQLLQQQVRTEDTVARYGGEEFIIILPTTEKTVAKEIGEQIRHTVEQDDWPTGCITISMGIATVTSEDTDTTFIKKQTKHCMYRKRMDETKLPIFMK